MPEQVPVHPLLEAFKQIVGDLGRAIGANCEVVLHDLRQPESSIIAITGNITGRSVGGPLTDLVLRLVRTGQTSNNLVNYQTRTPDGRVLRSSTLFIRDSRNTLLGCLCINVDLTHWTMARHLLTEFCATMDGDSPGESSAESFVREVDDILQTSVRRAIECVGKPVALMAKDDKLKVIKILDESGIFLIKGAAIYIANALSVSRYTVYNYLEETRVPSNNIY